MTPDAPDQSDQPDAPPHGDAAAGRLTLLVLHSQLGERDAFDGLVDACPPMVSGYCHTMLGHRPEDANDTALQRDVLCLYYLDDQPVAVVSGLLGVSSGTVKSRLPRARTMLRDDLKEPGLDDRHR